MKIYEHSENSVALNIYNNFTSLLSRLRCKYGFGPNRLKELVEQHSKILKMFREGDPECVERLIREHRMGSMVDLLHQIKRRHKNGWEVVTP
jgi:DNA-binding GntR family transcriptional regulator